MAISRSVLCVAFMKPLALGSMALRTRSSRFFPGSKQISLRTVRGRQCIHDRILSDEEISRYRQLAGHLLHEERCLAGGAGIAQ
jgi:hypothetical protein